jgi:hypothetical protein
LPASAPLTGSYPELTPYQYASNRPIDGIDLDGLEYLSFHRSMYRMLYSTFTEDISISDGTKQTISNSVSTVKVVYENIPASLQDSKTQSFKYVSGGPITTMGRDYTADELSNIRYNEDKYFSSGPVFYGATEGGKTTNGITPLKGIPGDNSTKGLYLNTENVNSIGNVVGPNGLGGMFLNAKHQDNWKALAKEGDLRTGFYNATRMVDGYLQINPATGENYFLGQLKGGADRTMAINFLTDGYLPTESTDAYTGNEYSLIRRNAYYKQLSVAWHLLQVMQRHDIAIRNETKNAVNDVLRKYKADGGGNELDGIIEFMKTK